MARRDAMLRVFSPTGFNLNIIANLCAREIFLQSHFLQNALGTRKGCLYTEYHSSL